MPVARKELKGLTPNFIRFTELTHALLLVSAAFFYDLYWPVRSVTVPSSVWVPSVIIWGCTIVVVVARLTLPSFRNQAVVSTDEGAGVVGRPIPGSLALRGYMVRLPRHRHIRCILARFIDRRRFRIGSPLHRLVRHGYSNQPGISEVLRISMQAGSAAHYRGDLGHRAATRT
jgi:hypothetical protein